MLQNRYDRRCGSLGPEPSPSTHIVALGIVSLLMGMSSAMVYGVLPVFLVTVVGVSAASVGVIEGAAEATTSLIKVFSGFASDWIGRRKPLVLLGYALSAIAKVLFPIADSATTVLVARISDRIGKGTRDAPRDAFITDLTPRPVRGSRFGLRLTLYTIGAVTGPLIAIFLMTASDSDFRLVFWLALIPAIVSVAVLHFAINEIPYNRLPSGGQRRQIRRSDFALLTGGFWWTIAIAAIFSLARFSPAFLVLKAHDLGISSANVPLVLVVMYLVYGITAYPCGLLADRIDRTRQLAAGTIILVIADLVIASADSFLAAAIGVSLWGLQMGLTQGLLYAAIADAAPEKIRGTAFGILDLAVGVTTFVASASAGTLWLYGGPAFTFGAGAALAFGVLLLLLIRPAPRPVPELPKPQS